MMAIGLCFCRTFHRVPTLIRCVPTLPLTQLDGKFIWSGRGTWMGQSTSTTDTEPTTTGTSSVCLRQPQTTPCLASQLMGAISTLRGIRMFSCYASNGRQAREPGVMPWYWRRTKPGSGTSTCRQIAAALCTRSGSSGKPVVSGIFITAESSMRNQLLRPRPPGRPRQSQRCPCPR